MDSKAVVKKFSSDLKNLDLVLLERHYETLDNISDQKIRLTQLAETCAYKTIDHPEWSLLAGRIRTYLHKLNSFSSFSETTEQAKILLHADYYNFVQENKETLNSMIAEERDYMFDWFGICTALKSYLMKLDGEPFETPQQMFLRVATWVWMPNIQKIGEMYDDLSLHNYMHATPTLFNSGLRKPQLASCFLMTVGDDLHSISKSWHDVAMISKSCGGIGIDISDIRHSTIANSGKSSGIVPMLKVHNSIVTYVDQAGKRKGSAAIYLPDYHIDILEFLELRKNTGTDSMRARDLFYALWISDLFMKRLEEDGMWSLFCPKLATGMNDCYGKKFEELYLKYEREEKYTKQIRARELWNAIYVAQVEVGMPYILFKDAANRKSNQKNLGTIRCSNLCAEILEYTSADEIASCNLANIVLKSCVKTVVNAKGNRHSVFDFSKLERLSRALVRNLNQVVDRNYYQPDVPQIKFSNLRHRPLGIGVQSLADVFAMMDYSWDSEDARVLNRDIFETIYYGAITESIKMAHEREIEKMRSLNDVKKQMQELVTNDPLNTNQFVVLSQKYKETENMETHYTTFEGSPASKGLLQFDLWDGEELEKETEEENWDLDYILKNSKTKLSGRYDWSRVRKDVVTHGMRNSLLVALMPTASTAHLIANNEGMEPFSSMISARTVLSGQFMIVNKYMVNDFVELGIWNKKLSLDIVKNDGSVQNLKLEDYISQPTKYQLERFAFLLRKYQTSYEMSKKIQCQFACERGRFICQTQSFNCFMEDPTYKQMTSFMMYQWKNGAKTGMYYLRSTPPNRAIKFAVDVAKESETKKPKIVCTDEVCTVCQ